MPLISHFMPLARQVKRSWHRASLWPGFIANLFFLVSLRLYCRAVGKNLVAISLIEHFGDIVACEPVSRYIRETDSDCYLIWIVRAPYRELLDYNPNLDSVRVVGCLSEWKWLAGFGLFTRIVDLHIHSRICPRCREPLIKSCGNPAIQSETYYHYGSILTALCEGAGLPRLVDPPRLYTHPGVSSKIDGLRLPVEYVAVHCASNERCRDWSDAKWSRLVGVLIEKHGLNIVEVGRDRKISNLSENYTDLCGSCSLLETAEVIRRARLFIGIDSGPAHLANAVGTPGVILLGRYRSFDRYLPFTGGYADGSNATLVYSEETVAALTVNEVLCAIEARLTSHARRPLILNTEYLNTRLQEGNRHCEP